MQKPAEEVVLVHGLWFGSWAMFRLAKRLEDAGFAVRRINYRTTRGELSEHARRLHEFARQSLAATQHFVGHSLGGLVILKMLNDYDDLANGRVVFLGSPLRGSRVARKAQKVPGSAALLGKVETALQEGYPGLAGDRETGMIAGSRSIGLGWLVGGTEGPGDGTVAIAETRSDGLSGHAILPVTHTGMLYSAEVAEKTAKFLESGRFESTDA